MTRDGHRIGELIPLRRRCRFVARQEFAAMSRSTSAVDLDTFRADQDAAVDHELPPTDADMSQGLLEIAVAERLALFTTNPADFVGLDGLLTVVPVTRPS